MEYHSTYDIIDDIIYDLNIYEYYDIIYDTLYGKDIMYCII